MPPVKYLQGSDKVMLYSGYDGILLFKIEQMKHKLFLLQVYLKDSRAWCQRD